MGIAVVGKKLFMSFDALKIGMFGFRSCSEAYHADFFLGGAWKNGSSMAQSGPSAFT